MKIVGKVVILGHPRPPHTIWAKNDIFDKLTLVRLLGIRYVFIGVLANFRPTKAVS